MSIYSFSSVQVDLPTLEIDIRNWRDKYITDEMKMPDDYELNKIPHLTLKYGVLTNETEQVKEAIKPYTKGYVLIATNNLDIFEQPTQDVLYIKAESSDARELHELLKPIAKRDEFPFYKPHITLAYLRKGYAKQFRYKKPFSKIIIEHKITFSKKNGNIKYLYL